MWSKSVLNCACLPSRFPPLQYVEVGEPAAPAVQPALVMAQQPLAQQSCLEAGLELQPAAA